jgi:predicted phage terminase large subunit-like protein
MKRKTRASKALELTLTESLYPFINWAWNKVDPVQFLPNWHVGQICEYLEAATTGEIGKLIINVPPGHQKSLTVGVFWNAWVWLKHPERRFMFTSYAGDLALRDADRTRNLIRSPEYQELFGHRFQLRRGQDTKGRYENTHKGYRYSTAIAGIMGEGGDHVVLDDPHNVQVAESETVREETIRLINLALPTRQRSKTGSTVVIMQRLHERDFTGHALGDDGWTHLCLPARFETDHPHRSRTITLPSGRILPGDERTVDGELLFPDLFPESRIKDLEDTMGTYGAAGQLQQRPVPREGGLFKREWFAEQMVDSASVPKGGVWVRGYDLAGSTRKTSPYTAAVKLYKHNNIIYVFHVERYKGTPAVVDLAMKARAKLDGKTVTIDIPQDPGQAGKAQVRAIAQNLAGWTVRSSPESGSKEQRADPFASQCECGNVFIVRGSWNDEYLDELCMFPGGTYKDQVDATSRAFGRLLSSGGSISSGPISGAS